MCLLHEYNYCTEETYTVSEKCVDAAITVSVVTIVAVYNVGSIFYHTLNVSCLISYANSSYIFSTVFYVWIPVFVD